MTKWEYKYVYHYVGEPGFNAFLNEFGELGWELVSSTRSGDTIPVINLIFKRKINDNME
jgi:hypothetical protein